MSSPYTSASARAAAAAAARRRSAGVHGITPKRSPFISSNKAPLNRSLQSSHVVENSGSLESYGASLPALVMEVLAFADRNTEMSVVLSPNGWAWLVCGRRLLIWKYKSDDDLRRIVNHQFRELTLSSSDLAHRAQLVSVFCAPENQVPSCISVSPEGFVRFWISITHESSYSEQNVELQGQECDSLLFLSSSLGCLLTTTTSNVSIIHPVTSAGSSGSVQIKHLKIPTGILGGISRRVSSLVFGSLPTQIPEVRLVRAVADIGNELDDRSVLVLSAKAIQKWYLAPGEPDLLLYDSNVEKLMQEGFIEHVWGRDRIGTTQLRVWLIDMQSVIGTSSVMILTAAVNPQISQELIYALVTLDTRGSTPPSGISRFLVLKHSEYYQESAENLFLSQRFILSANIAFIYSKNSICVSATGDGDIIDRVEFSVSGDSILGVGKCQGLPLFFSANSGIFYINTSSIHGQTSLLNESAIEDVSRLSEALNLSTVGLENISSSSDNVSRLQAAFLHFNKNNISHAQAILEELFPVGDNTSLDVCVAQLSKNLLDDSPAMDPRWAESNAGAGGTGAPLSVIILNQLKDKSTAFQYFVIFLQQIGIWDRLSVAIIDEKKLNVRLLLGEHAERLIFVVALRSHHAEYQHLLDSAIKHVLTDTGDEVTGKLTPADFFYRRVSEIEKIVWGLIKAQEEVLSADMVPRDPPATIHSVNSLLLSLLKAIRDGRETWNRLGASKGMFYGLRNTFPSTVDLPKIEYIPWTSSIGVRGLRSLLIGQHKLTVERYLDWKRKMKANECYLIASSLIQLAFDYNVNTGLARAEDSATMSKLYAQIVGLTDEILMGYQPHLSSLLNVSTEKHQNLLHEYEKNRYRLIHPLDFVFRWYLETGKRGKLLIHSEHTNKDLSQFLKDYTSLAWLHQFQTKDFSGASKTLRQLALDEAAYLSRRKTYLSLSKLSKLVSHAHTEDASDNIVDEDKSLQEEENLIAYQEQLPESVLNSHSLSPETMRVLSPSELIQLYIGEENSYANEYDFMKALELLSYVASLEEVQLLKKDIWLNAILRNSWDDLDTDSPIESISETVFFRTVDLAFTQGCDVHDLLIPIKELLESEKLESLKSDSTFQFLLQAGYEKINNIIG